MNSTGLMHSCGTKVRATTRRLRWFVMGWSWNSISANWAKAIWLKRSAKRVHHQFDGRNVCCQGYVVNIADAKQPLDIRFVWMSAQRIHQECDRVDVAGGCS